MTPLTVTTPFSRNAATNPPAAKMALPAFSGWCLFLYAFLLPVQVPVGADLRLAPSDAFLFLYLLARLPRLANHRAAWSIWHGAILLSLLLGTIVAAIHGQLGFYVLVQKDFGILTLFVAYACVIDFCTDLGRVLWVCNGFLWGVLINLLVALAALYASNAGIFTASYINFSGVRLAGLLIDPNAFGGLLAVAVGLHVLPRTLGVHILAGLPGRLLSALLPIGVILTFSRSAWIGTAAVLAVGAWQIGYRLVRVLFKLGIALALVGILGAAFLLPNASTLARRQEQVDGRVSILQTAYHDFSTNPIVGIGLGQSLVLHQVQIHNTTMFFLTELGPLGLLSLVGLMAWYAARAWAIARSTHRTVRGLGIGLLAAHLGMFGLSMGIDAFYQRHWWLVFGLVGALIPLAEALRQPKWLDIQARRPGPAFDRVPK